MAAGTPRATDLTTASTVALELGAESGDSRLPRLIGVASDAVRQYINRRQVHYQAAFTEKVASRRRPRLVLELTPVIQVASVTLEDGTMVDPSEYELEDAELGFLWRGTGWPWTGLLQGGLLQVDRMAGSERPAITVVYEGGWVTPGQVAGTSWAGPARSLPYDLEEAVVQTVVALYRKGGQDLTVASESLGDYAVSYRNPNALAGVGQAGVIPDSAARILDGYRRDLG